MDNNDLSDVVAQLVPAMKLTMAGTQEWWHLFPRLRINNSI